jgi:PilZ domain/Gram-negative bacterial TonB protein C-terminal
MSSSTDHLVALNASVERRFYPRITPSVPIYVAFGPSNLGTLLNVSENGFQVVTPSRLDLNSVYRVFLSLDGVSTVTVSVRTIWTADAQNSSGIQLLDLSEQDRHQIRKWVALQCSQNEGLESWFSPKSTVYEVVEAEPPLSPAPAEPADNEPLPFSPAATTPMATAPPTPAAESSAEPKFPPMPLPIHGEFSYQPPSDEEQKILRRRERKSHHSRSRIPLLILWTVLMSLVCVAAGWSFRYQLAEKFLHRPAQVATETTPPADTPSSSAAPDASAQPTTEDSASTQAAAQVGKDRPNEAGAPSVAPTPIATSISLPPAVATKRRAPTVAASKPNLDSLPNHSAQPEAPEVSRSYVADSAPQFTTANAVRAPQAPATETAQAAPAPQPATTRPAVDASTSAASRRSAIAGSISNSSDPSSASAPPASAQPSTLRANSFTARTSNPSSSPSNSAANPAPVNSAVIQMDVAEARVLEVTPPRNFTGNLTASYVNLPGERVLRSSSLTRHIQRSVRIPGDRIPGERWLWRGHKKVVLGELASRVDPQVSQLPVPSGTITVLATIDKDGYISNVKPLYGSLAFLPNVARALHDWRYQPTYLDNKPAETQAQIEIDFRPPPATRAARP